MQDRQTGQRFQVAQGAQDHRVGVQLGDQQMEQPGQADQCRIVPVALRGAFQCDMRAQAPDIRWAVRLRDVRGQRRFQHGAEFEHVPGLRHGRDCHAGALVGALFHHAVLLQARQGLADLCAADTEQFSERYFAKACAGR